MRMPRQSDHDWFVDNVLVRAEPRDGDWLRPSVAWRAAWVGRSELLREAPRNGTKEDGGLRQLALSQGFVVRRQQLTDAGMTTADIRSQLRRQVWWRPRRGTIAVVHPGLEPKCQAALAASAAALTRKAAVVSHQSAAVLYGLPVRSLPPNPVLTLPRGSGFGACSATAVHRAELTPGERSDWFGVPLTSVARTVCDLARFGRGDGLIAADAALRERLTTAAALDTAASACAGWPGSTAARWVATCADAGSESPLESLIRACLLEHGVPNPILQARISDPSDGWHCRVDMLWRHQRVILEADGRVKYSDGDGRALWREKRRQERLERIGYRVVRVLWRDVEQHPTDTVNRVWAALHR
jgi:hypothetical protein